MKHDESKEKRSDNTMVEPEPQEAQSRAVDEEEAIIEAAACEIIKRLQNMYHPTRQEIVGGFEKHATTIKNSLRKQYAETAIIQTMADYFDRLIVDAERQKAKNFTRLTPII